MSNINNRLKNLRVQSGLRQEQIAEYLGVTQTFISKVEKGERNLKVDQLEALLSLYGYSLSSFINEDKEENPIHFAYRAQNVNQDDLKVIANIGKIALNIQFMKKILEGKDAR